MSVGSAAARTVRAVGDANMGGHCGARTVREGG